MINVYFVKEWKENTIMKYHLIKIKQFFTLTFITFSLLGMVNLIQAQGLNEKPTYITVTEEDFQVDGKGKKTKEFKLTFTHPDGSKDEKGYFANKGDMFNVMVENKTSVPITIHWHGLIVPSNQDGVPSVSQVLLQPGKNKHFFYRLLQSGTYWMHSHQKFQEQNMLSAPLIIYDQQDPYKDNQEAVMFLEDFLYASPEKIFANLRSEKMDKSKPVQNSTLNDVSYDAFLTNKKTFAAPDIIAVKPSTKVRLRIINASSSTNFKIDTGKLNAKLIAVDGQNVKPMEGTSFPIGIANRVDLVVDIPAQGGSFPIKARAEGTNMQTGLVLTTDKTKVANVSSTADTKMGRVAYYELEKQLKATDGLSSKKVDKKLNYVLGGNLKGYVWTMNNQPWPNITPSVVNFGDRVEITYANKTPMSHPMHFHGHVFQVTEIDGQPIVGGAMRDTILVQPYSTVKVQFDALNPGVWVNHCHNLYHLNAGMLTTIQYQHYPKPDFYLKAIGQLNNKKL